MTLSLVSAPATSNHNTARRTVLSLIPRINEFLVLLNLLESHATAEEMDEWRIRKIESFLTRITINAGLDVFIYFKNGVPWSISHVSFSTRDGTRLRVQLIGDISGYVVTDARTYILEAFLDSDELCLDDPLLLAGDMVDW